MAKIGIFCHVCINKRQELLKVAHSVALTYCLQEWKNYIYYLTLYNASSCPFFISAMNVPLDRIHSWICSSSGSDCKRDCRVSLSIICILTPCIVAVVASAGNCISSSIRVFVISLKNCSLKSHQAWLYIRKAWDIMLVATQALVNLSRNR